MRLIIHLIRADAKRFAIPIALWIAITAGATTMDGLGPWMTADRDGRDLFTLATLVTWMTGTCVGAMLVALVVQQHPALGSNAWWMTRPVTPRMLLVSRLLLLGLVILGLPAVCEAVLMAAYGVAPGQMLRVALESCLAALFALGLLMVAAAVTTSLATFALLLGGCVVVLVVGLNIALTIAVAGKTPFQYWSISGFAGALIARPEEPTPMVLAWAVSIMTAMWLLRTLYTHRTRASVAAIGVTGGVVAIIVAVGWPWPLLHAQPGAPAWANALGLEAPPQSLYFDNAGFPVGSGPRWRTAFARVYITGVPKDGSPPHGCAPAHSGSMAARYHQARSSS